MIQKAGNPNNIQLVAAGSPNIKHLQKNNKLHYILYTRVVKKNIYIYPISKKYLLYVKKEPPGKPNGPCDKDSILLVVHTDDDFTFIRRVFSIDCFAALPELVLGFEDNLAGGDATVNGTHMETELATDALFFVDLRFPLFSVPFDCLMGSVETGNVTTAAMYALVEVDLRIDLEVPVDVVGWDHVSERNPDKILELVETLFGQVQ